MMDIFQDKRYVLQYEQINLDHGNSYGLFASELADLLQIPEGSRVLELGCGTGISTGTLLSKIKNLKITATDQSRQFLDLALAKFGFDDLEPYLQEVRARKHCPAILFNNCKMGDVESYLRAVRVKSEEYRHNSQISFYHCEAGEIPTLGLDPIQVVFASQVFHWFRKKNASANGCNYDYERKVLDNIRKVLESRGYFGFNTTGADYSFSDPRLNAEHFTNHPFHKAFTQALRSELGLLTISNPPKRTFDHAEIERIASNSGFEIVGCKNLRIERSGESLLESCLIGGHMQVFQSESLEASPEQREEMLISAFEYAQKASSVNAAPVIETGVHYATRTR